MIRKSAVLFVSVIGLIGCFDAAQRWDSAQKRHFPDKTTSNPYGRQAPSTSIGASNKNQVVVMTRGELRKYFTREINALPGADDEELGINPEAIDSFMVQFRRFLK